MSLVNIVSNVCYQSVGISCIGPETNRHPHGHLRLIRLRCVVLRLSNPLSLYSLHSRALESDAACEEEPVTSQGQREEDEESGSSENNRRQEPAGPRERQGHSHLVQSEKEKRGLHISRLSRGLFKCHFLFLCSSGSVLCLSSACPPVLSSACVLCQLLPTCDLSLYWFIIVNANGH